MELIPEGAIVARGDQAKRCQDTIWFTGFATYANAKKWVAYYSLNNGKTWAYSKDFEVTSRAGYIKLNCESNQFYFASAVVADSNGAQIDSTVLRSWSKDSGFKELLRYQGQGANRTIDLKIQGNKLKLFNRTFTPGAKDFNQTIFTFENEKLISEVSIPSDTSKGHTLCFAFEIDFDGNYYCVGSIDGENNKYYWSLTKSQGSGKTWSDFGTYQLNGYNSLAMALAFDEDGNIYSGGCLRGSDHKVVVRKGAE